MKPHVILMVLLSVMIGGCSSGGGDGQKTAGQVTAEGWSAYSAKNYTDASARFAEALTLDANFVDAYNGAGWSNAKLNAMPGAVASFTTGLTKDPANIQIKAGLAFVYSVQKEYALSIQRGNEVLAADSVWSFSRDLSIGAADIHLMLAEDYFAQGDFSASLQQVQKLNALFNANVSTPSGRAALSAEIERLRATV
jgi:tetratricopeptide (TPR) repeat protein